METLFSINSFARKTRFTNCDSIYSTFPYEWKNNSQGSLMHYASQREAHPTVSVFKVGINYLIKNAKGFHSGMKWVHCFSLIKLWSGKLTFRKKHSWNIPISRGQPRTFPYIFLFQSNMWPKTQTQLVHMLSIFPAISFFQFWLFR